MKNKKYPRPVRPGGKKKETLNSILNIEDRKGFVKYFFRNNTEAGEDQKVQALQACNLGPKQAGSLASVFSVLGYPIVKYASGKKNATWGVLVYPEGKNIADDIGDVSFPFGANIGEEILPDGEINAWGRGRERGERGREKGKDSTLLDTTSEITPQGKRRNQVKTRVLTLEQYVSRLDNCGNMVREFECEACGMTYYADMTCGMRTCPYCAKKRIKERVVRTLDIVKMLDGNRKKYGHRLRFVTLAYGTKNGIKKGVRECIKALEKMRRNLFEVKIERYKDKRGKWRTRKVRDNTKGCVYSIELGEKNLSVHIHILYWGEYIPQKKIQDEWKRLTGSFYADIRMVKNKKGRKGKQKKGLYGSVVETIKYLTKELNSLDAETGLKIERELFGLRTFGTTGIFYGKFVKDKVLCPFCKSDMGFVYIGVKEKTLDIIAKMLTQKECYRNYDTS